MGKPFKSELSYIGDVLEWVHKESVIDLNSSLSKSSKPYPYIIVGSGGSISAGYLLASLLQSIGKSCEVVTPLELFYRKDQICENNVVLISASGRNKDIKFAFQVALYSEPKSLTCLTMRKNNPLSEMASHYTICNNHCFDIPTGKDGFLATNSLIATWALLIKSMGEEIPNLVISDGYTKTKSEIKIFIESISNISCLIILYGKWGQPVSIDIESKCTEAGLINTQVADFRNFGHGRHHWIAKHPKSTALIALTSGFDKKICQKTLDLVPNSIPKLTIETDYDNPLAYLDLLIKSFSLINEIGEKVGIDPGKPGVPDFGSKLYHLNLATFFKLKNNTRKELSISRKIRLFPEQERNILYKKFDKAYGKFLKTLKQAHFGSVILDYDGTLCSKERRFKDLPTNISEILNKHLNEGFILGIATGRGKSVQESLQKAISRNLWSKVIIGYYNGTLVLGLNETLPNVIDSIDDDLTSINNILKESIFSDLVREVRKFQLTIETQDELTNKNIIDFVNSLFVKYSITTLEVLSSGTSVDVIVKSKGSKIEVIKACQNLAKQYKLTDHCLCIGDQGKYPGNDYYLLSTPFSLSVDQVSTDLETCWNLASIGKKNDAALEEYFTNIQYSTQYFNLNIE